MNAKQMRMTKFMHHDSLSCLSTAWVEPRPHSQIKFAWWQQRWIQRRRSINTSMTFFAAFVLTFLLLLEVVNRIVT